MQGGLSLAVPVHLSPVFVEIITICCQILGTHRENVLQSGRAVDKGPPVSGNHTCIANVCVNFVESNKTQARIPGRDACLLESSPELVLSSS